MRRRSLTTLAVGTCDAYMPTWKDEQRSIRISMSNVTAALLSINMHNTHHFYLRPQSINDCVCDGLVLVERSWVRRTPLAKG